jgi:uncharacterized OB-fold protein
VSDRDARPWWEALDRGELVLQRCDECDAWRWPPRAICNRCGSFDARWEQVSRRGTVASWIVNHHAFDPAKPSPYVVVMVRLAEQDDLLLPGAYAGPADGADLAVGAPVLAELEHVEATENGEPATLLRWRLA